MRKRKYAWGYYKTHKQHLFPGAYHVQSKCGLAYGGDSGVNFKPTKRPKCKYCVELARAY